MYTVKVVVLKKWCKIDTLLLYTTNKKYRIAYLFVPFPMTLDDIEGHSRNAGLSNANRRTFVRQFNMVLTDTARQGVRARMSPLPSGR